MQCFTGSAQLPRQTKGNWSQAGVTIEVTMYAKIGVLESRELAAMYVLEGEERAYQGGSVFSGILKNMCANLEPALFGTLF